VALNKKFAAVAGGMTAIGAAVALSAGTFSYFTDSAHVAGGSGTVNMGTLKLNLLSGDGSAQKSFTVTDAEPGATVFQTTDDNAICFENSGTMPGILRLKVTPTSANEAFNKAVIIDSAGFSTYAESAPLNSPQTLSDAATLTANGLNVAQLGADRGAKDWDSIKCIPLTVSIDPAADNAIQGLEGGFTIQADLIQGRASDINPAGDHAPSFPAAPAKG
jgi:hypothetical protein